MRVYVGAVDMPRHCCGRRAGRASRGRRSLSSPLLRLAARAPEPRSDASMMRLLARLPAGLPARRPPPWSVVVFAWSLLGPEDGGWWRRGVGAVRAAAASGVVGGGVGRGGGSVVSGTGLVSAWGGWGVPQPHSRSDPLSERLFHIACSPFVVAPVSGTLSSHARGRGKCASMPLRQRGLRLRTV